MISIFTAYTQGLKEAWQQKKMLLLLYVVNVIIAYLIVLPLSIALNNALNFTVAASELMQAFDITIYQSLLSEYGPALDMGRFIFTYGLIYILLNTFFVGGILQVFSDNEGFDLKKFLLGCVEYFIRFLRLFLISVIFIVAAVVIFGALTIIFGSLTQNAQTEFWPSIFFILRVIILIIILAMVNMLFDYAKIMTVVNDFRSMIDTTKNAMMFVMMSLRKTTALYGLYLITAVIIFVIYWMIESLVDASSFAGVLLFIIISQIYILSRIWIRLSFLAGQFIFYKYSNTAMPGMTKEMLDEMVEAYEIRIMK
jgi:hypothetical protein